MFPPKCVELFPGGGFSAQLSEYPRLAGSIIEVWFRTLHYCTWGVGVGRRGMLSVRSIAAWRDQRASFPFRSSGTDISARIASLLTYKQNLMLRWSVVVIRGSYIRTIRTIRVHYLFSIYFNNYPLHSWIKRDQLDVTCFIISLFNTQHVSDVNTSNLRSLRLICWVISWVVLLWFDVCWCYVVSVVCYPYAGWGTASACTRIPYHPSQTTT